MNFKKQCKNAEYANFLQKVMQRSDCCKYCCRKKCKFNKDSKTAQHSDEGKMYCFNGIHKWVNDNACKDDLENGSELIDIIYDDEVSEWTM